MIFDGVLQKWLDSVRDFHPLAHARHTYPTIYEFSENLFSARLQCVKFDGGIRIAKNAWAGKTDQIIQPCGMVSLA